MNRLHGRITRHRCRAGRESVGAIYCAVGLLALLGCAPRSGTPAPVAAKTVRRRFGMWQLSTFARATCGEVRP